MADCKRASPTILAINDSSPNGTSISKKRKLTPSTSPSHLLASEMQHQIPNSLNDSPEKTISTVNSAVTVASNGISSDHSLLTSSFSSGKLTKSDDVVKELDATPLDPELKTKGFETVDSNGTKRNMKSFREEEIDEFFARFEREEQKRFAEKYNFDIVTDLPLEGRYEWVRLH
ncbi:cyclin-dependent kinase inhibitor [Trifolium repens]|nr:cyclin-dependent kinase inhibitor [Trifolium repens]